MFSCTAIYKGIDRNGKLIISVSDGVSAYVDIKNAQFVNFARKNKVNKYAQFIKKKRTFLKQRNAITQILDLDLNPNVNAFESKNYSNLWAWKR